MGKGGNSELRNADATSASSVQNEPEILIDGKLYDVSSFKHPGGSVIKFLIKGGDATDAFEQFHGRSKTAKLVLKNLPKRDAPPDVMKSRGYNGKEALAKDFATLVGELKRDGFYDPSPSEIRYRCSEVFLMHVIGASLFMGSSNTFIKFLGIFVLAIASGRCGWLMHEGGHYSLTGNIKTDRVIQEVLYGIGCGMSAAWWRNQHNKHHATPQKLQHDVDLDTLPLISFNAAVSQKVRSPVLKMWLRYQAYLFVPVSCFLVALGWQYFLHPRHIQRTKRWSTEGLYIAIRHVLLYGFLFNGYTWKTSLLLYVLYNGIAASYIFVNFSLSHTHLPVSGPDEYLHWVEYSANHTTNICSNPIVDWWMAYLNFQIEHHLFPGMPQFRHKIVSPRVQKLFAKHGLHYDQRPYLLCLKQTFNNLNEVGHEASEGKKHS